MKPITQEILREIVPDFAQAIRAKKTKTEKPAFAVINFRNEKSQSYCRRYRVPYGLSISPAVSLVGVQVERAEVSHWCFAFTPRHSHGGTRADIESILPN